MARKEKTMRDAVWSLQRIKPYPRNPRTHPPAQIALLAELLKKHGPDQRIVVDENGVIIKGHGRLAAAHAAGLKSFPVVIRAGLSEAEKAAMRVSDNQVSLLAGWDKELLRGEITMLKQAGNDVSLLGFGDVELVSFLSVDTAPADFPEVDETISVEHTCPKCGYRFSGGK